MPLAPGIPQCHHVRTNGIRCGSPAMRGRNLCFFHTRVTAKPIARPTGMPSLEDGNAIQLGIAEVIRRVLTYDIDYKAAYCLLQAYKLALFNLKNVRPDPYYKDVVTVDPASDPQNAGAATEPLTHKQLTALEQPEAKTENVGTEASNTKDENATFKEFLMSHLIDPEDTKELATPPHEGAPSTDQRKQVQRIVVPKELSEAINADEQEMTEEQFMRLTSALFSTKTG